jgi:uncharacterized RDD family membrane protein YckC
LNNVLAASALQRAPSLGVRMACWAYEGVLLFGVVFLAGYLFGTLSQTRNALDNRHALQGFLFVVFGIYFVYFWSKGQTLAMKTWHIRVIDRSGGSISQGRALLRYVVSWIWFLPPLISAAGSQFSLAQFVAMLVVWVVLWALASQLHPQRQFWHDALAGTQLVYSKPMSKPV